MTSLYRCTRNSMNFTEDSFLASSQVKAACNSYHRGNALSIRWVYHVVQASLWTEWTKSWSHRRHCSANDHTPTAPERHIGVHITIQHMGVGMQFFFHRQLRHILTSIKRHQLVFTSPMTYYQVTRYNFCKPLPQLYFHTLSLIDPLTRFPYHAYIRIKSISYDKCFRGMQSHTEQ